MHTDTGILARPNAARRLVSGSAATAGPLAAAAGRERDEVEAEQVFKRSLKFIDFQAQLEFETSLRLRVEIACLHARIEIERLAVDGYEIVRGSETGLVFAVARERGEAGVDFAQAIAKPMQAACCRPSEPSP